MLSPFSRFTIQEPKKRNRRLPLSLHPRGLSVLFFLVGIGVGLIFKNILFFFMAFSFFVLSGPSLPPIAWYWPQYYSDLELASSSQHPISK
jgi:hypothetical protein